MEGDRPDRGMRIGVFVNNFPILSESFVSTLAMDLLADGHDVRVLAREGAPRGDEPVHGYLEGSDLLNRLSHSAPEGRLGLARALRLARERPRKAPALAALWALDRASPGRTAVTRHLAAQEPFDVVHCQFATLGKAALRHMEYGTLRASALVVHLRGYDITQVVAEEGPRTYERLFARADLFIANCEHFRQVAIGIGCPPDRCRVIGSPIDTGLFVPPEGGRAPYEGRPLRVVAVGRLVEKKGYADAIDAIGAARRAGLDARLDIHGEGPLRADLEARIAASGLGGAVRLRGAATQAQVIEALHAADIGLAVSVTAASGDQDAPVNTLKEKMATGLPVVATRHGGIPELVEDGVNGRLVPERDPGAIAGALAGLAARPETWEGMGREGRRKVVRLFDRRAILRRTLAAYGEALAISGKGSPT